MAINGTKLAVGQIRMSRGGHKVAIVAFDSARLRSWAVRSIPKAGEPVLHWRIGDDGLFLTMNSDGTFERDTCFHPLDLIGLIVKDTPQATLPRPAVTAPAILDAAAAHMRDRAATYDKPEGERSMAQTVDIFNKFHGTGISETQGWHFMQILKDVRLFSNVVAPHRDSIDDGVAYAALKGESLLRGAQ